MSCIPASLEYQHYRYTFITPDASQKVTNISVYLAHPDGATNGDRDNVSGIGYFRKLKVEKGEVATPWTPYSQDINRKIDTQTLDSANIDQMKTQGHYFVRNLSGNPVGGWVYVDVIGNNNRIRQDVYQDNGSKHMYRRGFNGTWSGWEQDAYLSDVKTEVTASVKNLGDRVTTQVNSITSKVDNMQMGGRNLLKGTRDFNSKYWYQSGDHTALADNPTDSSVKEIHSWLDWHSYRNNQVIQLDPSKDYMVSADIAIYNGNGEGLYVTAYGTLDGTGTALTNDVNLTGFPKSQNNEGFRRVYLPLKKRGRKLETFRIEGHGNWSAGTGSVFISKIMLYEGNTPLAWSDSSDDFVEAIKEVNTKWDVANGQIQGKVTATDVNNILNGKGYATQSWAQTMFQMKSDSITLQAVRDNITNGIQNQVNDTRNLLNNLQVGGRNYLQESDKLVTGWAQDLGTMPSEALNSLAGKTITVSVDVEWSNFKSDGSKQNRLGFELSASGSDGRSYWLGAWKNPTTASGKERISTQYSLPAGVTFTVSNNSANGYVSINGTGKVSHAKIEVGNQATDWTPAPTDDVGTNLLKGTANFSGNWKAGSSNSSELWKHEDWIDPNGNRSVFMSKNAWNGCYQPLWLNVGIYTFSCYYYISGTTTGASVFAIPNGGENPMTLLTASKGLDTTKDKWHKAIFSFTVTKAGNSALRIELSDSNATLHVASYKLEKGSTATDWSPAPEDSKSYTDQQITNTNKKIDTQVLDSANVDDLKTPGHYFIHNLTNSPITGWVYVDVAGGTDRLKQDVYQDSGYEHKSRRWFGNRWTEWTTDVNNKNVVSQINITPDQIKIASNKIVIDGNTSIHGTLSVPEVRLQGKSGMIGLDGNKGIIISSADTLFQTRVTKFGMDFLTTTNGQKEIMGGITTGFSTNNGNLNGISIVLDTQQRLGYPYGGDFFSIGNTTSIVNDDNRSWNRAMDYDASGQLHQGGFMWYEKSYLTGEGQNIYVGGVRGNGNSAYDPLQLGTAKFAKSVQPDKSQPTISLGYYGGSIKDGSVSNSGIGFVWNQMKPYGNWDITDVGDIWYDGRRFRFTWVNHPEMMSNALCPGFIMLDDNGGISSGICFAWGSVWAMGAARGGNIVKLLL